MPANPKDRRILIVKLGAIGDVVMTIPAAYAMHQQGYAIDWICGTTITPVLNLYPWINVISVDEAALFRSGKLSSLKTILSLWPKLIAHTYDTCATLYYDRRYKLLTLPVRARRKVSLSWTDRVTQLLPGRHHTDEYFRILSGRKDDVTPHQLSPIPVDAQLIPYPSSLIPGPTQKPRIVLIPGGARNLLRDDTLRRWPLKSYAELARLLLAGGAEVILSGGPDDIWTSSAFAALSVIDLTGKLSLLETLSLFHSADVTITHDTGPLHLAGLTPTALIGIFGPTDPRGRLPQRHNTVALWGGEGFACRPCYDGRDYAACSNNACIQQVTPAMILAEASTLLENLRTKTPSLPRVRTPKHTQIQTASSGLR